MNATVLTALLSAALSLAMAPNPAVQGRRTEALPGGCFDGPQRCYNALVDASVKGDDDRSVGVLLEWKLRDVAQVARICDGTSDPNYPWDQRRYAAAAMLHTDAAFRLSPAAVTAEAFLHLEIATEHLARGRAFKREGVREWARQWYFTVARCLRDRNAPYTAGRLLQLGRERLPQDPLVLAESGILMESIATYYAIDSKRPLVHRSWGTGLDGFIPSRVFEMRRGNLNDAAKWLRQAAALDPGNDETRLHLGRVLSLQFEDEPALSVLHAVAQATTSDAHAYLAFLFTAAIQHRQGKLDEAAASYRAAIARWPKAHAAIFGLSEVLQATRKGDESRDVLRAVLAERSPDDPYWPYQFDDVGVADGRLQALRDEVRR